MMLATIIAQAAMVAAVVALVIVARRPPGRGLAGRTVVVNLVTGESLRGVIVGDHADRLVLRDVVYQAPSGDHPADGVVHVLRDRVGWMQEPGA